ncbi:hypothetical protein AGMMS49940_07010 [Spirochaetia bacterium]|nr:hypothetical protein AGMMS49940_07010 [Spirochaetia bacterium]
MYRKLFFAGIALAIGIPLFPLGALFFLSKNRTPVPVEKLPESIIIPNYVPEIREPDPPQISAEQLALVFRPPVNKPPLRVKASEKAVDTQYSYLGLIRENNGQEWLYLKENETGRLISIGAGEMVSKTQEYCVVSIDGTHYFIRRN